MTRTRATFVPLLLVLGLAACEGQQMAGANPYPAPPPPRQETIPKPPVTEQQLIWQPGHWDWTGNGYVWREGQYVPLAGHSDKWQPGYWTLQNGTWTWVPAHWL
jgi:hypothetical protein